MSRKQSSSSHNTLPKSQQSSDGGVRLTSGPLDAKERVFRPQYLLFTGPDNLRHHKVRTVDDPLFIGENACSTEVTNSTSYFCKAAPGETFPKARKDRIGEIGWLCDDFKQKM